MDRISSAQDEPHGPLGTKSLSIGDILRPYTTTLLQIATRFSVEQENIALHRGMGGLVSQTVLLLSIDGRIPSLIASGILTELGAGGCSRH